MGKSSSKVGLGQRRQALITRSWIAELLLDDRLMDEKSRQFRIAWFLWIGITLLICLAAVALLALQIAKDIEDIVRGQHEQIVGTMVISANVVCMVAAILIYMHEVLPCRSSPRNG
ncbi:unnamed protein product [Symbiodinium natans]|uniref:Uncharacterized protein n=1 Tax=Symbiodinium natans TaxID=878477 RepID=A0A812TVI0_9DINO|nr:unnamed protein product [Symbiodinium natans]